MIYYLSLGNDNIIYDAVIFETEGYIQVDLPNEYLPIGINAGCYRWDGTQYVIDQELYNAIYAGE